MSRLLLTFTAALTAIVIASAEPAAAGDTVAGASRSFEVAQAGKSGERGSGGKNRRQAGGEAGAKGADCSGAGSKAAAQTGGKVLSVSGGGGSCSVTVLVPGKDGGRPRKQTVTIRP